MTNRTLSYAVELDGQISACTQDRLRALDDLRRIEGDCRVVSDLQGAIARTMSVEADQRYVELMISKKFQETGEFDEPVTVIAHWKKKQTKNSTDIFFTALPTRRYHHYLELVKEHGNHLILLPLHAVLLDTLRKCCDRRPSAVVFQHDRFADVIIGTRRKVWYANRVVAFDTTPEQIQSLWETIRTDIHTVGRDHRQIIKRINVVTWLESHALPEWTDPEAPELVLLDQQSVTWEDQPLPVSLPAAIKATAARQAIAPAMEKICYGARRLLPWLNYLLIFLALVSLLGGIWNHRQVHRLRQQVAVLDQNALKIRDKGIVAYTPADYKPTLAFMEQLWRARSLPGYGQLLRDLSTGVGPALQLEILKADYIDSKIQVEAFGTAHVPFDVAYKSYQKLQQQLRRRGYAISEERFGTRINQSDFMIRFDKELQ